MMICKSNIIISILSILSGTFIYIHYRQNIIFFDYINLDYETLYRYHDCDDNFLKYLFIYCLPDALWYLALLLIQIELLKNNFLSHLLFLMSIILPFVMEILQFYGFIKGTFDICDLCVYVIILLIVLWKEKEKLLQYYFN